MSRFLRRILLAVCLGSATALTILVVRSYWVADEVVVRRPDGGTDHARSYRGHLIVRHIDPVPGDPAGPIGWEVRRKAEPFEVPWPPTHNHHFGKHGTAGMFGPIAVTVVSAGEARAAVARFEAAKQVWREADARDDDTRFAHLPRPTMDEVLVPPPKPRSPQPRMIDWELEYVVQQTRDAWSARWQAIVPPRVVFAAVATLWAFPVARLVGRVRRRVMRSRRRAAAGLCVACGYDLRGSPGRCPECGHAAAPAGGRDGTPSESGVARPAGGVVGGARTP